MISSSPPPSALPDTAIVVRGGIANATQMLRGCGEHAGVFGFSVQSAADRSMDELAAVGRFPNRKVSVTTVGQVRALGHDVIVTPGAGYHATVTVPRDWDEAAAAVLAGEFELRYNPYPRTSP